jgi:hypothetical protein
MTLLPITAVVFGLTLTVAWVAFIGYELSYAVAFLL